MPAFKAASGAEAALGSVSLALNQFPQLWRCTLISRRACGATAVPSCRRAVPAALPALGRPLPRSAGGGENGPLSLLLIIGLATVLFWKSSFTSQLQLTSIPCWFRVHSPLTQQVVSPTDSAPRAPRGAAIDCCLVYEGYSGRGWFYLGAGHRPISCLRSQTGHSVRGRDAGHNLTCRKGTALKYYRCARLCRHAELHLLYL